MIFAVLRAAMANRPIGAFMDVVPIHLDSFDTIVLGMSSIGNQLGLLRIVMPLIFVKAIKNIAKNIFYVGTNTSTSTTERVKLSKRNKNHKLFTLTLYIAIDSILFLLGFCDSHCSNRCQR